MGGTTLMIVLRLIHIVLGVFWAGAAAMVAWFLLPVVNGAGPSGLPIMAGLMNQRKLSMWLGIAGGLAVLSGLALYARDSMISQGEFARSSGGMVYGIGAVTAVIAAILGSGVSGRAGRRIGALASQGPPSDAVRAEIATLTARATRATQWSAVMLLITVIAMAVARYF